MAQYDPTAVKTGIPTVLDTDTCRADKVGVAGLTTAALATGDACQVSAALTLQKALNTSTSPVVGVYDGVSGSVVRSGVVVVTMEGGVVLANGDTVYLSGTAGALTNVKPTYDVLHEVGVVVDAASSKVLLQPKPCIVLPGHTVFVLGGGTAPNGVGRFVSASGAYLNRYGTGANSLIGSVWTGTHLWAAYGATTGILKFNPDLTLAATYAFNARSNEMAFDGTYVYAPQYGPNDKVYKIDSSGVAVATWTMPTANRGGCCLDGTGNVWITGWGVNNIFKVRCSDGAVLGTYSCGAVVENWSVTTDGTYMYVAGQIGAAAGRMLKFRISDGAVTGPFTTGGNAPQAITYDPAGYVWVANYSSSNVGKLRCSDGALIGNYAAPTNPYDVTCTGQHIWIGGVNYDGVRKLLAADGSLVGNYGDATNAHRLYGVNSDYRISTP